MVFSGRTRCEKGEDLVEFTTDKATFNLPSPVSGKLTEILAPEGQNVNVGQAIGGIEE